MNAPAHCPACGLVLPENRLPGLCPACVWQAMSQPDEELAARPESAGELLMQLPGYEVIGELARGGMGIVYRARQLQPRRSVALKMLLPRPSGAAEMTARFRVEVRALTELEHPAILPVYHVGEHQGLPFFTMKLATGGTLAQRRAQYAGQWRACAELLSHLADAVQFAHEHGVLHRDLKPGNILFDEEDRPYVSDFGLAKLADSDSKLTRSVDFLGTPHYVAPEIAERSARHATIASDVYSLGAILYELLAGRPPFDSESLPRLLRKIAEDEPQPPSVAQAPATTSGNGVPRDLEVICLKCLSKEPAARYGSARELEEDLRRWLAGQSILARPASAGERAWRWARRNPGVAALSVALSIALGIGGLALAHANNQLRRAAVDSRHSLQRALLAQARALRQSGRVGQRYEALAALRQAGTIERTPELRDEAAAALAKPDLHLLTSWPLFWGTSLGLAEFTPTLDGFLAGAKNGGFDFCSASEQRVLKHYESHTRAAALRFRFAPRLSRLAVWFNDGSVQVWDRQANAPRLRLSGSGHVPAQVDFAPDERHLVAFEPKTGVRLLLLEDGRWTQLAPDATNVMALHYAPSGEQLAITTPSAVEVWDCRQGQLAWQVAAGGSRGSGVWSPDGRFLAIIDDATMEILVVEGASGSVVTRFAGHSTSPVQVAFHPDGQLLASIGLDRMLRLWESSTGREVLRADAGHCVHLRFSEDGRRLAAAPADVSAGIYELAPATAFHELRRQGCQRSWAAAMACSSNGRFLLTSEDAGLRLWDTQAGSELQFLPLGGIDYATVFFGPDDGSILYSRQNVGTFRRAFSWKEVQAAPAQISLGKEERLPVPLDQWLLSMGSDMAADTGLQPVRNEAQVPQTRCTTAWLVGGNGKGFEVWPDGDSQRAQIVHADVRHGLVYGSGDGRWVAKPRAPQLGLDIWDMRQGKCVKSFSDEAYSLARFSPDSRWLVAGSLSAYQFWQVDGWKPVLRFPADLGGFEHGEVIFSNDSRLAVLRVRPEVFELVALPEGRPLLHLESPGQLGTVACRLSPDGSRLFLLAHGARVFEWDLPQLRSELVRLGFD